MPSSLWGERATRGRTWSGIVLLAAVALTTLWSLVIPLGAGPDEMAHVTRGISLVYGELIGDVGATTEDASLPGSVTIIHVPRGYLDLSETVTCYAFDPTTDATCQDDLLAIPRGPLAPMQTTAGAYNPLYYALVSWPALFLDPGLAIHAMRILTGLLGVAVVGAAVIVTRDVVGRGTLLALAVATTPMVLFMAGVVNPNSLEIACALALWLTTVATLRRSPRLHGPTLVVLAIALAVLLNLRAVSLLWALLIVVTALCCEGWGRIVPLLRRPAFLAVVGVGAVAAVAALAWIRFAGQIVAVDLHLDKYADRIVAIDGLFGGMDENFRDAFGNFGWLDAPIPPAAFFTLVAFWLVTLYTFLANSGPARRRIVVGALAIVIIACQVGLQWPNLQATGVIWQGRYSLPLMVGLIVLVGLAVDLTPATPSALDTLRRGILWFVPAAHLMAFYAGARRYGMSVDDGFLTPQWGSRATFWGAMVAYAISLVLIAVAAARATRPEPVVTSRDLTAE